MGTAQSGIFYTQRTIKWDDEKSCVSLIDQTLLPDRLEYVDCKTVPELVQAIKTMRIRGAPAIGVAGAMGVALAACASRAKTKAELLHDIQRDAEGLRGARPTAVNLAWGVDRELEFVRNELPDDLTRVNFSARMVEHAKQLADEDVECNRLLSEFGQKLLPRSASVLTHCKCAKLQSSRSRVRVRSPRWATEPPSAF